jgi:hypothetical protein
MEILQVFLYTIAPLMDSRSGGADDYPLFSDQRKNYKTSATP